MTRLPRVAKHLAEHGLVADAGLLVALERGDTQARALVQHAVRRGRQLQVPTSALAQVWRNGATQAELARALNQAHMHDLTTDAAKQVGHLLDEHSTSDIVDAHVATTWASVGGAVATSDPDELAALGVTSIIAI